MRFPISTRHQVSASVFSNSPENRLFQPGLRVAFVPDPHTGSRVERAHRLLREYGFPTPEEAALCLDLPQGRWLSLPPRGAGTRGWDQRPLTEEPAWVPLDEPADNPLVAALVLGLCGPGIYHVGRPLLWTESRLRRVLELWAPPSP